MVVCVSLSLSYVSTQFPEHLVILHVMYSVQRESGMPCTKHQSESKLDAQNVAVTNLTAPFRNSLCERH